MSPRARVIGLSVIPGVVFLLVASALAEEPAKIAQSRFPRLSPVDESDPA